MKVGARLRKLSPTGVLVPLVNCALIVAVAYALAGVGWQLATPGYPAPAGAGIDVASGTGAPPDDPLDPVNDISGRVDVAALIDRHLFGEIEAAAAPAPVAAPETRLNLQLVGIFHSAGSTLPALALIAVDGAVARHYRVGDALTEAATLTAIDADRVLLSHNGGNEVLKLPRAVVAGSASPGAPADAAKPPAVGAPGGAPADAVRVNAVQVARRLRANPRPDVLEDLAYASPHIENGQFAGLRLKPGRQRELLTQLGLRRGDVLTELNGTRLTDPGQSLTLLQSLLKSDQVQARVVRNGTELPFTFVLAE